MLCVAGCYRRDIAANSRRQNRGEFALCVSRHLLDTTKRFRNYILNACTQKIKTMVRNVPDNVFIFQGNNTQTRAVRSLFLSGVEGCLVANKCILEMLTDLLPAIHRIGHY